MPLFIYDEAADVWREAGTLFPAQGGVYKQAIRAWVYDQSLGQWRSFKSIDMTLPQAGVDLEKTDPGGGTSLYDWEQFQPGAVAEPLLRQFEPSLVENYQQISPSTFPGLQNLLANGDTVRFVIDRESFGGFVITGQGFPEDYAPAIHVTGWPSFVNLELEFLDGVYLAGRGGKGGRGGSLATNFTNDVDPEPGGNGGCALFLENDVTIIEPTTGTVTIAGGGGGGGGGGPAEIRDASQSSRWARAGGGGGAAGATYNQGASGGVNDNDGTGVTSVRNAEQGESSTFTPGTNLPSEGIRGVGGLGGISEMNDTTFGSDIRRANGGRGGDGGAPGQSGFSGNAGDVDNPYSSLWREDPGAPGGQAGPAVVGASRILNLNDLTNITFLGSLTG